jgi:hypothetical protein
MSFTQLNSSQMPLGFEKKIDHEVSGGNKNVLEITLPISTSL